MRSIKLYFMPGYYKSIELRFNNIYNRKSHCYLKFREQFSYRYYY